MSAASVQLSTARQESLKRVRAVCNNKEVLREIWQVLDANGNGSASLAEIDRMVHMLSKGRKYGGFFKG